MDNKENGYKVKLSFSQMTTFRICRQRWAFGYQDKITNKIDRPPLFLGGLVHKVLARLYQKTITLNSTSDLCTYFFELANSHISKLDRLWPNLDKYIDELEHQKNLGMAMITGYMQYMEKNRKFEPIPEWVEKKFEIPIPTPSGHPSNKFIFRGAIDGIVKYMGHYWVHEIKTSSGWSEGDIQLLSIDPQIMGYCWAAEKTFNIKIAGAIFSVIGKCQLKLKKTEEEIDFRSRIIKDYSDRPERYFHRHFIYYNRQDIDGFANTLWEMAKDMSNPRIYKSVGKSTCGFGCNFKELCLNPEVRNIFYINKSERTQLLKEDD